MPPTRTINVVELNPHAPRPFVFTDMSHCLRDSLRLAGYRSDILVNAADAAELSIVCVPTDGWKDFLPRLDPRRTVLFNFEQLGGGAPLTHHGYLQTLAAWTVADYHSQNVQHLQQANGPAQRVFELPMVPGPSVLYLPEQDAAKTVDVLFFGTLNERRTQVIEALRAAGLVVEIVAGAYGWELTPAVRRARLVLHVHFYDTRLFPVARMLQPVVNGVPVVCETSVFSRTADWRRSGIVFADHADLVDACLKLLGSPQRQLERVQASLRFVRQLDFAAALEPLLAALDEGAAAAPAAAAGAVPLAEIEAILHQEASALPPESHLPAPPLALAQRTPGQGRWSRIGIWLMLGFMLLSAWHALR